MLDHQFLKEITDAVKDALSQALPASKRLFTLDEAAEYIGRSPKAVERLIQRGSRAKGCRLLTKGCRFASYLRSHP